MVGYILLHSMRAQPNIRPVTQVQPARILSSYSFGPALPGTLTTGVVNERVYGIRWEPKLEFASTGECLKVIDFDPASSRWYPPVNLNEAHGVDRARAPLPSTVKLKVIAPTLLLALLLALCFLDAGCTTRDAYRPVKEHSVRAHLKQVPELHLYAQDTKVPEREHECLEKYSESNFWLGHVEMTDYGTYQTPRQIAVLERAVESDTHAAGSLYKRGITVVVFVHGWSNNAQEENPNLNSFRKLLSEVAAEQKQHNRGVLGVYLSWRGESMRAVMKPFTYWGRARAADTIGHGIMVEALTRIRNIHWLVAQGANRRGNSNLEIYKNSRLVLIGHSFGGRALYDAVAEGMETNFLQPYWAARSFPEAKGKAPESRATMQRVTGFGDIVLLINPAIKSLPYRKIHYAMHSNTTVDYDPKQPVLMMVLSSRNDTPNRSYLPVGETFGNRFRDWFARGEDRTPASQNTTALGHWNSYHTHDLSWVGSLPHLTKSPDYFEIGNQPKDGDPPRLRLPVKTLRRDLMSFRDLRGNLRIKTESDPGLLPYMVVSVDPRIINGHSGFWPVTGNERAYDFVKYFISAQNNAVGAARAEQAAPAAARIMPAKY